MKLNPYLNFAGNAREAMEYYHKLLGGKLDISTFADLGQDVQPADGVMHSLLTTDAGIEIMASDAPQGMELDQGSNFSLAFTGFQSEADTMRALWENLSSEGNVVMTMEKQVWGDEFGMVTDKFGINWMISISQQ